MPRKPAERVLAPALALAGTIAAVGLGAVTRPAPAPQPQATPPASTPSRPAPATQPEASAASASAPQEQPPAVGGGEEGNAEGVENGAAGPPAANAPETTPAANGAPKANGGEATAKADDDLVYLALKEVKIEDTIPFIVEWSGKVVMLRLVQVAPTKITLVAEENRRATRREALDLLFQAFRLNGIGVVETEKLIIIDLLTEITKIQDPGLLLGPHDDVMKLSEDGLIVSKIFPVHKAKAEAIGEQLREFLPDYATMTIDVNTNQIVLQGTVGLAKRVQMFIDALDAPAFVDVKTETFRMQYADAQTIADAIQSLFEATRTGTSTANRNRAQQAVRGRNPQLPGGGTEIVNTSEQLRVVTLPQLNAITVSAEPDILAQIKSLIVGYWDIPLSAEDGNPFRVYNLQYADPVQVRDVLQAMLEGSGASSSRGRTGGASRAGQPGGLGESAADAAVANIFRIDALADTRQLVVVSRTPANFAWLDEVISELDQPTDIGEPLLIPLKHANAVEVAEQLNALLSEAGSNATITGQQSGLTRGDVGASSVVQGGGASAASAATGRGAAGTGGAAGAGGEIQFPWQRGRPAEDRAPEMQI
ncbi:MAG: hypothetical protein KDA22_08525, partial [Phycisphaerales bacterium]|nr:hypothetical protein [Phycisphaerales bacterium]